MGKMTVTPQTMISLADTINGKVGEWNAAVQSIYRLVSELDAMWDGTANEQFKQMFQEDQAKFNNLAQLMTDYTNAIKTAANNYIQGEEEVKSIVSRR